MTRCFRRLGPLALGLLAPLAAQEEVRLAPCKDTTLYEDPEGDRGNGAGQYMFAGVTGNFEARRCLLAYPVSSAIPKGSTIHGVTVELFMSKTIVGSFDFAFHRVSREWGEGASDAPLDEGGGTAAEPGDATWLHTFYPTDDWTTPGGDFDPATSGVFVINDVGKYFLSSPGLLADVEDWVEGSADNHGWVIKQDVELADVSAKRFSTRETPTNFFLPILVVQFTPPVIGANYCGPAENNSSGGPGMIAAIGSEVVADNSVILRASGLPNDQFGYFLNSQTQGFVPNPGGSQGNLCLGGGVGRYATQVASTGTAGGLQLPLDLATTPTPGGDVAIQPGETWNFTCWFRDLNPGSTSNFTDGVSVTFQ